MFLFVKMFERMNVFELLVRLLCLFISEMSVILLKIVMIEMINVC